MHLQRQSPIGAAKPFSNYAWPSNPSQTNVFWHYNQDRRKGLLTVFTLYIYIYDIYIYIHIYMYCISSNFILSNICFQTFTPKFPLASLNKVNFIPTCLFLLLFSCFCCSFYFLPFSHHFPILIYFIFDAASALLAFEGPPLQIINWVGRQFWSLSVRLSTSYLSVVKPVVIAGLTTFSFISRLCYHHISLLTILSTYVQYTFLRPIFLTTLSTLLDTPTFTSSLRLQSWFKLHLLI